MAMDGIIIAALSSEMRSKLSGGRISKIAMPEKDELLLTINNSNYNYKLLISVGSNPVIYISDENKQSPINAPAFCMLLRKHINGGRIIDISQSGLERIVTLTIYHLNELGDPCSKKLIVELMGKYSNVIFTDNSDTIIDSIKRIPSTVSSLREVLPGKKYFLPDELKKQNPLLSSADNFTDFNSYEGISNQIKYEIQYEANNNPDNYPSVFFGYINKIRRNEFSPSLILRKGEAIEFSAFYPLQYNSEEYSIVSYDSVSALIYDFYSSKNAIIHIKQKSAELRKLVNNLIERAGKKLILQEKQIKDCLNKDKYKVYGDLLNTYGYSIPLGSKQFSCENFYDNNNTITIPLDENKTASQNAKKYFDKYQKLRRTEIALANEIVKTRNDLNHLTSVLTSLDLSDSESDLNQIKEELCNTGYIKRNSSKKTPRLKKAEPLHFISSEGFDIYVGKNNYQNEEVSFKLASNNDLWFHVKGATGSHVIIKTNNTRISDLPDTLIEEAAGLAAYYSELKQSDKVEVDYTIIKELKKVAGAPPGFVIYHTNYSVTVKPSTL